MYSPPRIVEEESDSNEAHNEVNNLDKRISMYLTYKRVVIVLERIVTFK